MKNFKSVKMNFNKFNDKGKELIEPNYSHSVAVECGFSVDVGYDVYTYQDLGAFVTNISSDIKFEVLKCNPFHKILDMMKQGYKFCLGPAFPAKSGYINKYCQGLFCSNYREIFEKENQLEI